MIEQVCKGKFISCFVQEYGNVLYEVVADGCQCGCGESDGLVLEIVSNDRFDVTDREIVKYNSERFTSVSVCMKSLLDDFRHGRARLLSDEEAKIKKEQLLENE